MSDIAQLKHRGMDHSSVVPDTRSNMKQSHFPHIYAGAYAASAFFPHSPFTFPLW